MLDPAVRVDFRRRAITAAMAELCLDQGYPKTTVTGIAARAAMGRGTIYALYPNREAIFLDLIERFGAELLTLAEVACIRSDADPRQRIGSGLGAILGRIAEEPLSARAFLLDAPYASEDSLRGHRRTISGFASLLAAAAPSQEERPPLVEEGIVADLAAILARDARDGRLGEAPTLLEDFVGLTLAPYPCGS
jgi:AcrR family transcriptional regulator